MRYGLCFLFFVSYHRVLLADTCPSTAITKQSYIVDIKVSVNHGARLLTGAWSDSPEDCLSRCCQNQKCDLSSYRSDGVLSDSGHNCYLVHCGRRANCVMAAHDQFTSFVLDKHVDSEGASDSEEVNSIHNIHNTETHTSGREHSITDTPDAKPPPVNKVTPSPVSMNHSSISSISSSSSVSSSSSISSITPTSTIKSSTMIEHGEELHTVIAASGVPGTTTTATDVDAASTTAVARPPDAVVVTDQEANGCGSSQGCHDDKDLAGIIAVAALGGVAFIAVFFVSIVVIKRILDNKKQKQFRNVDYLINGMYS